MEFTETKLKGAFLITPTLLHDERGFFARSWCQKEFRDHGLNPNLAQCNISFNKKRGTLRGMHFQSSPFEEAKLIRVTRGASFDVIIDLRPDSDTFLGWVGVTLTEDNRKMIYAPEGFAHGFLTLEDHTEVFYQMSQFHSPEHAQGVRWNDPLFAIRWPEAVEVISEKDRSLPDCSPAILERLFAGGKNGGQPPDP